MKEGARFDVSQVFKQGDEIGLHVARMVTTTRAFEATIRAYRCLSGDDPAQREAQAFLFLMSIGTAREAAKAFGEADQAGIIERFLGADGPKVRESVERLRQAVAGRGASRALVTAIRNTAFHFDRERIEEGLALMRERKQSLPLAVSAGEGAIIDTGVPFAEVMVNALVDQAGTTAGLSRTEVAETISRLQVDLWNVVHGLFRKAVEG